ncbi:MBL fold hydrolase [Desulfosarcina alkanivorans]|uniref:MBL fold hydrolase n=1 Tax=Desulfosarcina alkanivorans TaxID=571177 RepID=A0A5K7YEL9_9BACT|nr:MBL fold metallo-hydrolase [Desulfosarcina alkanivorans]BBO67093.1 MBL fold hydrolase [Desulfosarcina alkanivorans]
MNIVKLHRFNAGVTALEMGYGMVGRPLMNVHCYLVGDTLIDSGQTRMARTVKTFIRGHRIRRLLLTHHHEDHSGNAALVAGACGATVLGHPLTARKMVHIHPILPYQHFIWGRARRVDVSPLPAVVESDGYRFIPIHTPGHSRDHTVYLEPGNGWLFCGDLYLGDRIKFFRSDEKIDLQIRSLRAVLRYDFEALFCGHNPVLNNGRRRLRAKLAYLEDIAGTVRSLMARGLPEREIIRRLDRKQDRLVKTITMGNVSFANMVRSAIHAA